MFPMLGSTREISRNPDVVGQSWLLDVAQIPKISPPNTPRGTVRKNGIHYADVDSDSGLVTLRSDPITVELLSASSLASEGFEETADVARLFESFGEFWEFRDRLVRPSVGAVLAPEV